ncbi:aldehyde dehydrogenase domain-containing protein [Aspergillus pseudotamarii]|uniref:succinate-semialdehyde dehydrogenase [NAD(P)(+)] n=1 Tax=Aspergillus pseudotamarii TaxID=132259 RepID=A0A5N6T7W6_ASPPS|nr:aldehyde dehydrogenase domain-containing protein [Aspergillus pseudotamarii]KAE8142326.1 aldehyde dehydrogenase domain-containing protein [Aspergillus pseudotamarii]
MFTSSFPQSLDIVTSSVAAARDLELFVQNKAFIDGIWVRKEQTFSVYEPSTAQVFGSVADCDLSDVQLAIESAYAAQKSYYSSTTAAERGGLLRKWHNLIMENVENLATILCLENGKTIHESRAEIAYAGSFVAWFAEEATRSYGDTIPSSTPNTMVMTTKEPVGVCGIITPWNFPAAMICRKVAPALGAGCAVVIKPPSETPFTCLALTKLALDAGFPGQVIQVCPTKNREVASELARHPLVRKISFTGSTSVGKSLAKLASGTLKKASLELGGNAPFIVFDDADVDLAVEGAMMSKFRCSGQTCVCANRIYVQRGILEEFTRKLVQRVSELRLGPGIESSSTQGPLINRPAVDKVKSHIEDAVSKGARVEIGGSASEGAGYFMQPTVLSGVTRDMAVAREETFGPLAPIFPFETEDEIQKLANDTEFGLAGYFYSRNVGRVMRVARELEVGMCGVNTGKISATESPFGGIKESGYGLEGSKYGMAEYQTIKTITLGNIHL